MNNNILEFIKEMKELTGESFLYKIEAWEFSTGKSTICYTITSNMSGFDSVSKETEEEIEQSFRGIRMLVNQLIDIRDTKKRINTKLLNKYID